ncbi:MAG: hypothetical protein HDKAJFGB_00216 [Anaerolineae bacterium]|nr:hypothetical protein [Anaerolineae bacterium]
MLRQGARDALLRSLFRLSITRHFQRTRAQARVQFRFQRAQRFARGRVRARRAAHDAAIRKQITQRLDFVIRDETAQYKLGQRVRQRVARQPRRVLQIRRKRRAFALQKFIRLARVRAQTVRIRVRHKQRAFAAFKKLRAHPFRVRARADPHLRAIFKQRVQIRFRIFRHARGQNVALPHRARQRRAAQLFQGGGDRVRAAPLRRRMRALPTREKIRVRIKRNRLHLLTQNVQRAPMNLLQQRRVNKFVQRGRGKMSAPQFAALRPRGERLLQPRCIERVTRQNLRVRDGPAERQEPFQDIRILRERVVRARVFHAHPPFFLASARGNFNFHDAFFRRETFKPRVRVARAARPHFRARQVARLAQIKRQLFRRARLIPLRRMLRPTQHLGKRLGL